MMEADFRDQERVGEVIDGNYRLLRLIGSGGMGAVFEAHDARLGRRVAIKLLRPEYATNDEAVERFQQEAWSASSLAHPNIVSVVDSGRAARDRSPYIALELLTGEELRARLDEVGRIAPREALEIVMPIMAALAAAHGRGIVHRDIKPENIFLARGASGEVVPKLIDFGISKVLRGANPRARATLAGIAMGTPDYMSPEQARGDRTIDERTDVWSIGAVLYEMLAGRCPFEAPSDNLVIMKIITEAPPRIDGLVPDLPPDLADVVHRALEPDRDHRLPTMHAFLDALLSCSLFRSDLTDVVQVPVEPTQAIEIHGLVVPEPSRPPPAASRRPPPPPPPAPPPAPPVFHAEHVRLSVPPLPVAAVAPAPPPRRISVGLVAAVGVISLVLCVAAFALLVAGGTPELAPTPAPPPPPAVDDAAPAVAPVAPEPTAPAPTAPVPVAPDVPAPTPAVPALDASAPEPPAEAEDAGVEDAGADDGGGARPRTRRRRRGLEPFPW